VDGASPVRRPAVSSAQRRLVSPSRWVLKPVTAEAGSAPYLLTAQPTVIGRVQNEIASGGAGDSHSEGDSQSQCETHGDAAPLKIGINAAGKAGISRTHAALQLSNDGESLTIVGKSDNLINAAEGFGSSCQCGGGLDG
jgi:hypothetical protein